MAFEFHLRFGSNKEQRSSEQVQQTSSLNNPEPWLLNLFGNLSEAGIPVTKETAMRFDTVFSCIRVLSETFASFPLSVFMKTDSGRIQADTHPVFSLIKSKPSPLMTAYSWKQAIMVHLCTQGNSFSRIIRNQRGNVAQILLFPYPECMTVSIIGGQLWYKYPGVPEAMSSDEILHFAGMSWNGIVGMSPITYQRETIGLGIAQKTYSNKFYSNGTNMGGIVEVPNVLGDTAYKRLKESFDDKSQGLSNAHKAILLEGGAKYNKMSITPVDAQYVESRKLTKEDICGIFRVPPHMIANLDRATFSNIEQQSIEFISNTMTPYITSCENELDSKLFSPSELAKYYVKFNVNSHMRGDATARSNYYYRMWLMGALNPNEVRELEDLNKIEGGDTYFVPVNVQQLTELNNINNNQNQNNQNNG